MSNPPVGGLLEVEGSNNSVLVKPAFPSGLAPPNPLKVGGAAVDPPKSELLFSAGFLSPPSGFLVPNRVED